MAGWLSMTLFCKREHLPWMHWLSVKLKWGRTDLCQRLRHLKEIYRLIHSKKILCYSCEFVPQKRSSRIILGPKQQKRTGVLTVDSTWGGLNSPKDPSWLAYSAKLSSHFTRISFLKVGISGFEVKPQNLTKLGTFESLPYITVRTSESFHKYIKRFLSRRLKRLDNKPAIKCHGY